MLNLREDSGELPSMFKFPPFFLWNPYNPLSAIPCSADVNRPQRRPETETPSKRTFMAMRTVWAHHRGVGNQLSSVVIKVEEKNRVRSADHQHRQYAYV